MFGKGKLTEKQVADSWSVLTKKEEDSRLGG